MKTNRRLKHNEEEKDKDNDTEINLKMSKSEVIERIYNAIGKCVNVIFKSTIVFLKLYGIYLLWVCLHYVSAHLYTKLCVPAGVVGFIMSPFMMQTPHCQGLRWIVYNAGGIINNVWVLLGAWLYSILISRTE